MLAQAARRAVKAGMEISPNQLETHYLSGGRVPNVITALISAQKAKIPLSWDTATAIDLAGRDVLATAQTGTGKTLAYLVPAILSGKRVLVSTGTKNLQEQIFFKDVPFLRDALGIAAALRLPARAR